MNREIKFRAFDVQTKTMHYVGTFQFDQFGNFGLRPNIDKHTIFPMDGIESGEMVVKDPLNAWHTMQYTGLKDKDGKEIYEGDWCRAEFRTKEGIQVIQGQIIVDEYMWCIDCTGCAGNDIFSINRPHDFEVIGNIYENPELLKP